jgi:hypothetical protein
MKAEVLRRLWIKKQKTAEEENFRNLRKLRNFTFQKRKKSIPHRLDMNEN